MFLSWSKTVSRSPWKEEEMLFPLSRDPQRSMRLAFQSTLLSSTGQFHCFFPTPGIVPKRLRVPSQHFLKSISPLSEAELANRGLLLPVGAPGQGKGSPHQWSLRVWLGLPSREPKSSPGHIRHWQAKLSICLPGLGGSEGRKEEQKPPPTQPAPASTLRSGKAGVGGN